MYFHVNFLLVSDSFHSLLPFWAQTEQLRQPFHNRVLTYCKNREQHEAAHRDAVDCKEPWQHERAEDHACYTPKENRPSVTVHRLGNLEKNHEAYYSKQEGRSDADFCLRNLEHLPEYHERSN